MDQGQMRVAGRDIPYRREQLRVSDCYLDPENPRLQYVVGRRAGHLSQEELDRLLWAEDQVKALAQSIQQNGGVREPIIVREQAGKYIVKEGNCRVVATRRLSEQNPEDARFSVVPAYVFVEDLSNEDLAVLLAELHVAGKIRWDAYEQAKMVWDLQQRYGKTWDWLSNHLRMSKSSIHQLVLAYQMTTEYLEKNPDPENIRMFSYFMEVAKRAALRKKFEEGKDDLKARFHRWLASGRLTDAKQVRSLPQILDAPEALKVLDELGFRDAYEVLVRNDPSLSSDHWSAIKQATEYVKKMPGDEIQELRAGSPQKIILLRNLHRAIEDLATLAGLKL